MKSVVLVNTDLGKGLSPNRYQAITWTNADLLLIGPFWNKLQWNFNQNTTISYWASGCVKDHV